MRRTLSVLLILGLLLGALMLPAEAKKKKKKKQVRIERVIEHTYEVPSPGIPGVAGLCLASYHEASGCIDFPTALNEKFVKVEVHDTSGQTPVGILAQDSNPDSPGYEIFATFCGAMDEPVELPNPGMVLRVSLYAGPSADCHGVATAGHIQATVSNRP